MNDATTGPERVKPVRCSELGQAQVLRDGLYKIQANLVRPDAPVGGRPNGLTGSSHFESSQQSATVELRTVTTGG